MIWTGEREGVAFASNRQALDHFVRAFRVDEVLHVALADGSTCGWDAGVAEIATVRRRVQHDEELRRRRLLIGEPPVTVAAFRA